MHLTDFFAGFFYDDPSVQKIRYAADSVGIEVLAHPHFSEAKRLFLAHKAIDRFMLTLLGPAATRCNYVNYPMSALINFSAHQLTMRRFQHNRSQKLVQIGCFTGEEFLVGVLRNISVDCHLVANPPCLLDIDSIANSTSWQGNVEVIRLSVGKYLSKFSPRIGVLVLANMGAIQQYREALESAWNYLDPYADIIACGDFGHLSGLREALLKDGVACTDMFLRERPSYKLEDSGILLIRKQNINYLDIIAHDDR